MTTPVWYHYAMLHATRAVRYLTLDQGDALVGEGAAYVDLRPAPDYLDVHIPRSLCLGYEFGPGMAARARDCLPLDLPLVLLASPNADMENAAAALQGKGFSVVGIVRDGLDHWGRSHGRPASTEALDRVPEGAALLDVGDPGCDVPEGAVRIPAELLWTRTSDLPTRTQIVVAAGFGVRAALAVGILERAGHFPVSVMWCNKPRV